MVGVVPSSVLVRTQYGMVEVCRKPHFWWRDCIKQNVMPTIAAVERQWGTAAPQQQQPFHVSQKRASLDNRGVGN